MARVKYFCVQALMSVRIILLYLYLNTDFYFINLILLIILILVKLGAAPFHFWFASVIVKISWFRVFWLSTFQKIIPLFIIIIFYLNKIWVFVTISSILIPFLAVKQIRLKKLLAYSSIFRLNWLLARIRFRKNFWIIFLGGYTIILLSVLTLVIDLNQSQNRKLFSKIGFFNTVLLFVRLLSLIGIPPITIFFIKLKLLSNLQRLSVAISSILILGSVILIFIYSLVRIKYLTQQSFNLSYFAPTFYAVKKGALFIIITSFRLFIYIKKIRFLISKYLIKFKLYNYQARAIKK